MDGPLLKMLNSLIIGEIRAMSKAASANLDRDPIWCEKWPARIHE
jgi:hypothetical protein